MSDEVEAEPGDVAPDDQGGGNMHVHKPKAVHGWRELASEIGVIVVGIAIALLGEQAVEALHWRHEVHAEGEALRQEVRANLGSAAYRQSERACIDTRLAGLAELSDAHPVGQECSSRSSPCLERPWPSPSYSAPLRRWLSPWGSAPTAP